MGRVFALTVFSVVFVGAAFGQDDKKDMLPPDNIFHPYPDGGIPVGDFRLQDASGQFIGTRDLRGKIWIAQFFYFPCNTCAKNTPTVKSLQDHYRGKQDVCFVSISLTQSDLDTLQAFAKDHEAEPNQWFILTGPDARVSEIVSECFYSLNFKKKDGTLGDMIAHKTDLVLIDANGIMVGYVEGTSPGAAESLKEQIDKLRTRRRMEERIPIVGGDLPRFNALLNSTCTILLLLGWIAIRTGYQTVHKLLMLSALAVSAVFLASYLFYHFAVMGMEPMRFQGEGAARYVYFAILLSHTILAIAVAPLAIYITVQGLRNALAAHVKLARWTLPIWLYVSVTGVVVYWMLYRMAW